MAATMEAAMFIMINMYGYVCVNVCVHMHEYVGLTPPTLISTQPPTPCNGGDP